MHRSSLFASIALFASTVLAQGQNHFINPPIPGDTNVYVDNKNFSVGSTVDLQWTTNYPLISLILWQNDNASYYTLIDNQPATQSFSWPIDLTGVFDLRNGAVFFFQMWNMTNDGQNITDRFSSHYFNLVNDGTTSTATATSSPTGAVGTASSLPNAMASSTSTSTSSPSSSGLSTGAKAGIGIGVALGALGALAGLAAAFWFIRRRKGAKYTPARSNPDSPPPAGKYDMPMEQQQQRGQPAPSYNAYNPSYAGPTYAQDVKGHGAGDMATGPAEMSATQATPVEMSAENVGPRELDGGRGV